MEPNSKTFFAPQLIINDCAAAIEFYKKAFGVTELGRWVNDDGTVHVAELSFDGCIFHIHEPTLKNKYTPESVNGVTTIMGVFVDDPHAVFKRAVDAGAIVENPVTDYEYGYRQGSVYDPFGHNWLIEKKL
jgi:PhnB protein